mmetsp:Transcript_31376/g.73202  ORF Transcript_31376/g.73202 Transcript_31376/m.73202 type:complete len:539 (+) Transcript_31376:108-1724(+)
MSGVRIYRIVLDKEPWENVPGIIYKSCQAFDASLLQIQNWTKDQERRNKEVRENQQQVDARLDAAAADMQAMRDRMDEMSAQSAAIAESLQREGGIFTRCLWHLLHTTRKHHLHLGEAFQVESPLAASEKERLREMASSPPEDLSAQHLAELLVSSEVGSSRLDTIFEKWESVRADEVNSKAQVEKSLSDLAAESTRTQERLLAWREMLKESSHAIDSLGSSLASMRGDVELLQDSQVRQADVEQAVGLSAAKLEEKLAINSSSVDSVSERLGQVVAHMDSSLEEVLRATEERIEHHSLEVHSVLERHLNPVSAFLNSMNVKADTARTELDGVKEQVPRLAADLKSMQKHFSQTCQQDRDKTALLEGRLKSLEKAVTQSEDNVKDLGLKLTANFSQASDQLGQRIDELGASVASASAGLETLQGGDVAQLTKLVAELEQKMARWVHANPLPAKISEARLYSLEARLAQEMDARLQLEDRMRLTPQSGILDALQLPVLSKTASGQVSVSAHSARRKVGPRSNLTPRAVDQLEVLPSSQG